MQKILHEKELHKIKQKKLLVRLLFVVVAVLFILQITLSGILATSGDKMARLEQRYLILSSENGGISQSISQETSLKRINLEAEKQGFQKSKQVIYIPEQTSVALGL